MNWETLLCLGDSITIGARTYLGYPEYAGHYLKQHSARSWNVVNFARSGITAVELHRMVTLKYDLLRSHTPQLVTVLIGTNDIKLHTSTENFRIAYEQVVTKALLLAGHRNLVLFEIPLLRAGVKYPYTMAMNARVGEFNQLIRSLAREFGLRTQGLALTDHHFCDGVHLNEEGVAAAGIQLATGILAERGLEPLREMNGVASLH